MLPCTSTHKPLKASQDQTVLITAPPFPRVLAFRLVPCTATVSPWPSTRYQISPANLESLTKRPKYRLPAACRVPLHQKHRRVQVVTLTRSKTQHHGTAFHDTVRIGLCPHGIRRYSPRAQSRRPASPTARIWGSTAALKRAALTANPPPVHYISCCPSPSSCFASVPLHRSCCCFGHLCLCSTLHPDNRLLVSN